MDKREFLQYILDNFDISGEAYRLISNILDYAEILPSDEQYSFLCDMLDGTIGLSDAEIRKITL